MAVTNESFLVIEKSLSTRLRKAIKSELADTSVAIANHVQKGEFSKAYLEVNNFDITDSIKKERKFILLTAIQAALYGARDFNNADSARVLEDGVPDLVETAVDSTVQLITGFGNENLRDTIKKLIGKLEEERDQELYKVQKSSDFITKFISFAEKSGKNAIDLGSSLHTSRLASWGFLTEATLVGHTTFKVSEVLDVKICPVCRSMHNKVFNVDKELNKLISWLSVGDPADLRVIAPWPKQDKTSLKAFLSMSDLELVQAGWGTPPYHPLCRGILRKTSQTANLVVSPPLNTADLLRILEETNRDTPNLALVGTTTTALDSGNATGT